MTEPVDPDWVLAALDDVAGALEQLIAEIDADPEQVAETLREGMPAIFAKLNYAWNTRALGPTALETHDHDALVAWPQDVGI
ncbi:MAG: hypothetical protein PHP86_18310 [Nevskiales bacterium]|nr:hypothetical protein [Nevskiales bacterium]